MPARNEGDVTRAGGGRYNQEVITNWRGKPDFDLDYPFYGFDKVDLAVMHSDEVEGHYSQWLRERHPDPDSLALSAAVPTGRLGADALSQALDSAQ